MLMCCLVAAPDKDMFRVVVVKSVSRFAPSNQILIILCNKIIVRAYCIYITTYFIVDLFAAYLWQFIFKKI